jgi:hypothetical protein
MGIARREVTPSTSPAATALESAAAGFIRANAAYRQAYATWRAERESRQPGECATSADDQRRDRRHEALFAVHRELDAAAAAVRRAGGQIDYSPNDGDTVRVYGPRRQLLGRM